MLKGTGTGDELLFPEHGERQLIKRREAVGLGPEADSPRSLYRLITHVYERSALERDLDCVSLNPHTELLCLTGRNRDINACNLPPDPFHDVVEVQVVFKRVDARHVVVIRVLDAKHQSRRLVDFPGDWRERDTDFDIAGFHRIHDAKREAII